MRSVRYEFFRKGGNVKTKATRTGNDTFRVISSDQISTRELDILQELVNLSPLALQRAGYYSRLKMGYIVTDVKVYGGLD